MPSSVEDLLSEVGLVTDGSASWGERLPVENPGVYVVSTNSEASNREGPGEPHFDQEVIAQWMRDVPELRKDGRVTTPMGLTCHLAQWWLPGEPVLYIGKATSLTRRVAQYYRTRLGAAKPHKGGYWLKILSNLPTLTVHYAITTDVAQAGAVEDELLRQFIAGAVPPPCHPEPDLPLPFANLTLERPPPRRRRGHRIDHAYK